MIWGIRRPYDFGQFWPSGDFEHDPESNETGWYDRLRDIYSAQSPEEQLRLYDYRKLGPDQSTVADRANQYRTYVSSKFTVELGKKDPGLHHLPVTHIQPHEVPRTFDLDKTYKSLGSLIVLNDGIFAVDGHLKNLIEPIQYQMTNGGPVANGIKAELLPDICGVWLAVRRESELHPSQEHLAKHAEVLMQAFAKVGIVALVDEATGYQLDRAHDALRLLLGKYIADGLQKWIHTFPDTFFSELDRLNDNPTTTSRSRPQYYDRFINKYGYDPIEHGYVKPELDKLNITDEGKRRARFHKWLTDEGRTILTRQIGEVEGIMEMCDNIEHFKRVATRQKAITVAPYLFDEMNRIID